MSLLGRAAIAMWWTIAAEVEPDFSDWHSHEHFPERMSISGFLRGSRWKGPDGTFFVLYELETYEVLTSAGYLNRLNAPSPWSTRLMPHHLGMVRSQCRVDLSFGGGLASSMATVRLTPGPGATARLRTGLEPLLATAASRSDMMGAHLLVTDNPRTDRPTTEQVIRGSDRTADWIVLLSSFDAAALRDAVTSFTDPSLQALGASGQATIGFYDLALGMTAADVAALLPAP